MEKGTEIVAEETNIEAWKDEGGFQTREGLG